MGYLRRRPSIEAQRQVYTNVRVDEREVRETATCPFCGVEIVSEWDSTGYLRVESGSCVHFSGFVAGHNNAPTAFYRGPADGLKGGE